MRKIYRKKEQGKTNNPFNSNQLNRFGIQLKLHVGKANDKYEKEANSVADKIVAQNNKKQPFIAPVSKKVLQKDEIRQKSMSENILFAQKQELVDIAQMQSREQEGKKLQMQQEEEEEMIQAQPIEEEEEEIQPKMIEMQKEEEIQASMEDYPIARANIEKGLNDSKGTGSKMDDKTRQEMESGFGADFSTVNIHTNNRSVEMNNELGAQAFTHGNDVYFNEGKYAPGSKKGKHLLAHELTHTIQQSSSGNSAENQTIRRDISTPVKNYVKNPDTSKAVTFKEGNITIVVMPDTTTNKKKMKNRAETTFSITDINTPGYETSKGKVTKVDTITYPTITIQTIYGPEVSATSTSAYGKGTTANDKKAGNTSLGYHEGSHGADYINYLKNNPAPTFSGVKGMKVKEFKKAIKDYKKAWKKYRRAMGSYSENLTDCVGTKASFCPTP